MEKTVSRDKHGQNIWEYPKFSREIAHHGKILVSLSKESLARIDKSFLLGQWLGTRLYFHEILTLCWTSIIL